MTLLKYLESSWKLEVMFPGNLEYMPYNASLNVLTLGLVGEINHRSIALKEALKMAHTTHEDHLKAARHRHSSRDPISTQKRHNMIRDLVNATLNIRLLPADNRINADITIPESTIVEQKIEEGAIDYLALVLVGSMARFTNFNQFKLSNLNYRQLATITSNLPTALK